MIRPPAHGLHPLAQVAVTFVIGATAGALLIGGIELLDLRGLAALLDASGGPLQLRDRAAAVWIAGQLAILVHHIVPTMLRA